MVHPFCSELLRKRKVPVNVREVTERFLSALSLVGSLCSLSLLCCNASAAEKNDADLSQADNFFGLTNVWTIHLKISAENWQRMQPELPPRFGPPGRGNPPPNVERPFREPAEPNREGNPGAGDFLIAPGAQNPPPEPGVQPLRGPPPPEGRRRVMGMGQIDFPSVTADFECAGQTLTNVALRFKGNSSFMTARNSLKKSFKVDFNDFVRGQKFLGMAKLNVNNNAMDPAVMREAIAYDIFRQAGVPAARTAFAKVYLTVPGTFDREYLGAYTLIEQVDERFLEMHYATRKGLLLKPEAPPGLPYLGESWSAYKGERPYDPQTNGSAEERQRFIEFTRALNRLEGEELGKTLNEFIDVPAFLRFLAVNAAMVNLDSYLAMGHNFYLYVHPKSHQLHWIPWDLNHAFGGFMAGGPGRTGIPSDQSDLSIRQPNVNRNPVIERLLADPKWKAMYLKEFERLIEGPFKSERVLANIDAVARALRSAVNEDRTLGLERFERAVFGPGERALANSAIPRSNKEQSTPDPSERGGPPRARPGPGPGPGLRTPLKSWIEARAQSIRDQLDGKSAGRIMTGIGPNRRPDRGGPPEPGGRERLQDEKKP
jgi:spore coat protein H